MHLTKIFFILIFSFTLLAAQDKLLTMEDAILGSRTNLKIENLNGLQWHGDGNTLCWVDSLDGNYGLISASAKNTQRQMLLSLDSLNHIFENNGYTKLKRFPGIRWIDTDFFRFTNKHKIFTYQLSTARLLLVNQFEETAQNLDIHKKSFRTAYVKNNNLFIAYDKNQTVQITHDTVPGISNGNNTVHRNEFGIYKGTFWSPEGNFLAYYHLDRRMVSEFPLVDLDSRPAKVRKIRYPMTGMTSEQVQIAVYNLNTGSTVYLQTGQPADQYLPHVTWSSDEKYIYVVHLNRDQNHLRLIRYNAATGLPVKTLFEEKNPHWVEPEQGPIFVPDQNNRFLWFSKKEGFNQLYLYNTNGKLIRKLTKTNWDVTTFLSFDKNSKYAFISGSSADGMERHIYRIKLSSGKMEKLTTAPGIHRAAFSKSGTYFIDRYSSHTVPRRIDIVKTGSGKTQTLLNAVNPLAEYDLGKIQFLKLKNKNGTELNARMILPIHFEASKKYPVIVYVYGGPHGQMISDSWISGWRLWFQYMAEQGYIVFTLDNRGTNNRGLAFEQAVHRQLGTLEVEDQMVGVDYLKSLAYVDTNRIGVHGWSYGGFMTISMMTRKPGVFKVGIAGGPVIDWRYYEVMYGERYMDTPQSNYKGYETASLFNYVDSLDGSLLIIHGAVDPTVVWQNSLLYLRKAIDAGKQLDYFVYPGDEHNMRGKDRLHLYQKITDYFKLHL